MLSRRPLARAAALIRVARHSTVVPSALVAVASHDAPSIASRRSTTWFRFFCSAPLTSGSIQKQLVGMQAVRA